MFSIKPVDRGTADAVMLCDLRLAATWSFEVTDQILDQILDLLFCQFGLSPNLTPQAMTFSRPSMDRSLPVSLHL
jgi:hypothetical protein